MKNHLIVVALFCLALSAQAQSNWPHCRMMGRGGRCGLSSNDVGTCMRMMKRAQEEGLPDRTIRAKMNEALAKQIPAEAVTNAIRRRVECLKQAETLLGATKLSDVAESRIQEALALALESGVAQDDLAAVLKKADGQPAPRLQAVIEAGETLSLAGLPKESVRKLMDGYVDGEFPRCRILSSIRSAVVAFRKGVPADQIEHEALADRHCRGDTPAKSGP